MRIPLVLMMVSAAACTSASSGEEEVSRLGKPRHLVASNSFADHIDLTWDNVEGATGYSVFKTLSGEAEEALAGETDTNSYSDGMLPSGQTIFYYVVATAEGLRDSEPSDLAIGQTVTLPTLATPQGVAASDGTYFSRIRVTWEPVTHALTYRVEVAEASTGPWAVAGNASVTTYDHGAVNAEQSLFFRVIAVGDGFSDSLPSDVDDGHASAAPAEFDTYFKASNTDSTDVFGSAIALSADGNTLAVGALYESSSAAGIDGNQDSNGMQNAGAVYLFRRDGFVWRQEAYVKASNPREGGLFGTAVALSADGNTLAVGSSGESSAATGVNGNQSDESAPGAGAVYVFACAGSTWSQEAFLKASNTEAYDNFGLSVALSSSGDTLAVGAWGDASASAGIDGNQSDNTLDHAGAVFVFVRASSTWSQQAYVKASNPGEVDRFGYAIDLSSDGNTLIVGAWGEKSSATGVNGNQSNDSLLEAGAAYVYSRSGTTWSQQAYLKASNTDAEDGFGFSVAVSGDGDTVAVGAFREAGASSGVNNNSADNSAEEAGAVYVFRRNGSAWSFEAYVKASNTDVDDEFGHSVSLSADGNLLAVGAPYEDGGDRGINGTQNEGGWNWGAIYLLSRAGSTWSHVAYVKAPYSGANDELGTYISLARGGSMLAGAAMGESSNTTGIDGDYANNNALNSGAVYTFGLAF